MQRAIFTQISSFSLNGTAQLSIAPAVNDSFGGEISGRSTSQLVYSSSFASVTRDFQKRATMQLPSVNCDNCSMSISVSQLSYYTTPTLTGASVVRLRCRMHFGHHAFQP